MKMKQINLQALVLTLVLCFLGTVNLWAEDVTGTIKFGSGTGSLKISDLSVTGEDNNNITWTITTTTNNEKSFTQNASYSQIGASSKPVSTITFEATLPTSYTIKNFSTKFGGFSSTKGTIKLFVDDSEVGTGNLNADKDVTVTNSSSVKGKKLKITVTGISKGVKAYNISYTYDNSSSDTPVKTLSSIAVSGNSPELWKNDKFSHDGITVTATYSDNSTVDVTSSATFTTPDMKTAGDKTVKVSYNGKETSYTATVKTIANTIETAYTTEQAIALIDAGNDLATQVYVKGTISKIESYASNTITYWLDNNTFEVFKGKGMGNTNFTATTDITVGANVVIFGKIKKYSKTYEFDSSNYLVQYEGKAMEKTAPKFTTQPISKVYAKGNTAANMTVAATGNPEPTYQWYTNTTNSNEGGTAISGATATTYKPTITELGTKYYYCVATNSEGSVASSVASIAVKDNNTLTVSSSSLGTLIGASTTFNVSQTGDATITVESKDPSIATASISDGVVTITGVKAGTTTIIVRSTDTDKYKATSKSVDITVINAPALAEDNISFNLGSASLPSYIKGYGLGDDYNSAKSKLKFDDANDFIVIGVAYSVGNLSFTMKGNSFSKGTFSVLESNDNVSYTTVEDYTSIATTETVYSLTLKNTTRYIKFFYTKKGSGNIGLGNIVIEKAATNSGVETAEAGAAAWTEETYSRTIATGKFSTICLPYNATVEGATLYKMAGKNLNGGNVESLTFEAEENNTLVGGVPYLFIATKDAQTFTKADNSPKDITPAENVSGFRGTYSKFELPVGSYFLYNNGDSQEFRPAGNSGDGRTYVNVGAFKCYISSFNDIQETPMTSEASRRITLRSISNDETTGIVTLDTDNVKISNGKFIENGRIVIYKNGIKYNLNGQTIR